MDPNEFRRLVRHGLGRAVLHLQQNDPAPYLDVIIDACLHNRAFDEQMNGRRGHYLWELIQLSGSQKIIRDALIESLSEDNPDATDSFSCVPALLRRFAEQGDSEARDELYKSLHRDPTRDAVSDTAVRLDGLDGLLTVARQIGGMPDWDNELSDGDWAMHRAYERFGDQAVWDMLEAEAERDLHVEKFLVPWRKTREHPTGHGPTCPIPAFIRFDEVQKAIEDQARSRVRSTSSFASSIGQIPYFNWGAGARDEDIAAAAEALARVEVDDRPRLVRYLRIFQKRAFPGDLAPLLHIIDQCVNADGADIDTFDPLRRTGWALTALDNVSHPCARALAFELRDRNDWWRSSWIGLLRHNYEYGDHAFIEASIRDESDEEAIHSMGMDVEDLVEGNDRFELVPSLELLYDRNPCGYCRGKTVRTLHRLSALPEWMIEECGHDSDEDTREFVASISG